MNQQTNHLIRSYLKNLRVATGEIGFITVWPAWRDLDYTPDYNKFYFILEGEGWLKIGGREYYPKPGQLFLMPEGICQSYSTTGPKTFTKYWCHFNAKLGDMNLFDVLEVPPFINVNDIPQVTHLFKKLLDNDENHSLSSILHAKAAILELIAYYLEHAGIKKINRMPSGMVDKLEYVTAFIEDNLSGHITVDQLAGLVHLHPNYFTRLFKKHLGTTPIQYINSRRMEEAKRLFMHTDCSLAAAAERVGVQDVYYLSKLFKEYTGYTPTDFRRLVKA